MINDEEVSIIANEFFQTEEIMSFWAAKTPEVTKKLMELEDYGRIKRYNVMLSNLSIEHFKNKHITFSEIKDIFLRFSFGRIRAYGDKRASIFEGICTSKSRITKKDEFFRYIYISAYDKNDILIEALHFRKEREAMDMLIDIMLNDQYFEIEEYVKPNEINLDA